MQTWLKKLSFLKIIKLILIAAIFCTLALGVWLFRLNKEIQDRIGQGWFRPPVEIYSRGEQIHLKQRLSADELIKLLAKLQYRERFEEQSLHPSDYSRLDANQCEEVVGSPFLGNVESCVYLRTPASTADIQLTSKNILIGFDSTQTVTQILSGSPLADVPYVELTPQLFAQFYGGEPILRKIIQVGDAPLECLQAATAIEDSQFLEHKGVSVTGLSRALMRNLLAGRYAQGGSTITQQLVKNYFLTPEKTLKRKFSELFMAILLEANLDKDQILENYLNIVYMGQRGPFQVIGFSAASDYYFSKPLQRLNLPECALLAAIINSPGRYNPFTHAEQAQKRRDFVLDRMAETQMIEVEKATQAKTYPLPAQPDLRLTEPAPYFTQAVFREIDKIGLSIENGLRVFTTLDVEAQDLAQRKVLSHVLNLEKNNKKIAKIKTQGKNLESSLISVEVRTGEVMALVGGRQYIKTQYNRVLDAHRQVGSIMKPFVYLTALESQDPNGDPYTPTTIVDDVKFVYSYEGQSWSPKNYTNEFLGPIPLFYALKNSINAATAKVGLQVGLSNIVDVARRAGITSEIKPYPSITLGAFEIYPWEVAGAALTIARMGERIPLTFIRSIESLSGENMYKADAKSERAFAPQPVAILIGMMKQTLQTGTGRLAKLMGFDLPAAGKTGTTSDTKDTWFMGFTPYVLTLTWTGYDDNTPSTLTGASGALPLWTDFMKSYATRYPAEDFKWPSGVERFELSPKEYLKLVPSAAPYELEMPTELIR
ncbi:MAG: PBP1A family penicillin-binding protein [Bdellovibrionales bacterium]|nr:PBP1A family penicillin-binding protein [Bdellovibrionales bacterium]